MEDEGIVVAEIKCTFCDKKQQFMKLCSRCRTDIYCSKECQVKDWPEHKRKCTVRKDKSNKDCSKEALEDTPELKSCKDTDLEQLLPSKVQLAKHTNSQESRDSHKENITIDEKSEGEDTTLVVFIKHNKVKSQLHLKVSQDSLFVYQQISDFVRIPVAKLKLVCKGKIVNQESILSHLHNKAVFLALGEVSECEDGIDRQDIETLMKQLNVERNIAVKALRKTGSLLDAIFDIGNNM